jgi:predicted methyltransferase
MTHHAAFERRWLPVARGSRGERGRLRLSLRPVISWQAPDHDQVGGWPSRGRFWLRAPCRAWFRLGACDIAAPMRPLLRRTIQVCCALPMFAAALLSVQACASAPAAAPVAPAPTAIELDRQAAAAPSPQAIVDAPDRTPEDREVDARRQPVQLLEFLGVMPGERVADLAAGSGYTTELLARAVGSSGVVYAQNDKSTIDKHVSESWPKRLQRQAAHNVVRMDREFDAPFTPEARDLDLVTLLFSYHDVIAGGLDRKKLNAAVRDALKPGGLYVVADHQAPPGTGVEAAGALHRIDEKIVRQEIESVGFTFVESADFLRDPNDEANQPSYELAFKTDRFILKFKKPEAS